VFLSYDVWWYELTQLYDMGYDGVIIWTSNLDSAGKGIDFSTAIQQDWWRATGDFIKMNKG
jgi:hypothetical protein